MRYKNCRGLLILCLAYYTMRWVQYFWNWGIMAFTYRDMGCVFHEYIVCIFCNSLDMLSCCSLIILLCNGQNIAEYEAYWLMGVPIINPWGLPAIFSFKVVCANEPTKIIMFSASHWLLWLMVLQHRSVGNPCNGIS